MARTLGLVIGYDPTIPVGRSLTFTDRITVPDTFGKLYVPGGGGSVAHGRDLNLGNVGYTAYFDSGLGRLTTVDDLQVISGDHWLSDFAVAGGVITRKRFTGTITVNVDNVTFNGCLFDNPVGNYLQGQFAKNWTLNYCTIFPTDAVGDQAIYFDNYTAYRCLLRGNSDGAKINGNESNLIECYVRVKMQDSLDHNDGLQNVGGEGNVSVIRCNISADPEGGRIGTGPGGPNSALQSADMGTGAHLNLSVVDCLLDGGGGAFTLRLYDGGISTNIQYTATGNRFVRGTSPVHRGSANITPISQISWSNNRWDDDSSLIALV